MTVCDIVAPSGGYGVGSGSPVFQAAAPCAGLSCCDGVAEAEAGCDVGNSGSSMLDAGLPFLQGQHQSALQFQRLRMKVLGG